VGKTSIGGGGRAKRGRDIRGEGCSDGKGFLHIKKGDRRFCFEEKRQSPGGRGGGGGTDYQTGQEGKGIGSPRGGPVSAKQGILFRSGEKGKGTGEFKFEREGKEGDGLKNRQLFRVVEDLGVTEGEGASRDRQSPAH